MTYELPDDYKHVYEGLERKQRRIKDRLAYLREHPDALIKIDPEALYDILTVDYLMVCARESSVAGNRAIRGSDIDAGAIITVDYIPIEKQHKTIGYLREVGFKVYHPNASAAAEREIEGISRMNSERWERLVKISHSGLHFVTLDQVAKRTLSPAVSSSVHGGAIVARHGSLRI